MELSEEWYYTLYITLGTRKVITTVRLDNGNNYAVRRLSVVCYFVLIRQA